jgi:hypothetical protein
MTKFDKTKFETSGEYVHYEGKFVARFKHKGPFTKAKFLKELIANHRKGFARWRERCDARILPHYILDLLCEKDTKGDSFIYLAEVSDAETLDLLRGLFHYNLVEELIIYLFPYSAGKGNSIQAIFPVRQWQLHKAVVLPGGICRLIYRNPCRM